MRPDLIALARQRLIDDLERAWEAHAAEPGEAGQYRQTIQVLVEQDLASRAAQLAVRIVDALAGSERLHDAITVATDVVRLGAHNDAITSRLLTLYELAFASEDWYPVARERAGLKEGAALGTDQFLNFDRYRRYTVGNVVYHRSGWGEGLIETYDATRGEVRIRFASGRVMELPLASVYDSMVPLDDEDLRAMKLKAPDELMRLANDKPAALIRMAAKVLRGRVTGTELKDLLVPVPLPGKSWASFWKRARAAATLDPYLQITGSPTRPVFELRRKPLALADEARLALRDADDLGGQIAICRDYLQRCTDDTARLQILDLAHERVQAALQEPRAEAAAHASHAHRLDGLMLLERHGRPLPGQIAQELRALLLDRDDRLVPENFNRLTSNEAREHAIELLPEALGPDWARLCIDALLRFPASTAEPIVERLVAGGHAAGLLTLWPQIAPFPRRHPVLTFLFARLHAEGAFAGLPNAPDDLTVARVVLHVARTLSSERRDPQQSRLLARIVTLLTGRRGFLARALEAIDRDALAGILGIADRGGEDFPQEIIDVILRAVARQYPDLTAKPERPFWEEDAVFVTRAGLSRQREEYRRLVEEKIPANSKAIGAAASLGDLSENSEWDAALEEQRNLTTRASMMDQELRRARLLEEIMIPEGIVAPGTRVRLVAPDTNRTQTLAILGPWDAIDEGTINYRAPAARPLLGAGIGDEVELLTEHGPQVMRVEAIERIV